MSPALENKMRSKMVAALRSMHAFPVENPMFPGTPDIAFIGGWIECKRLEKWPKDYQAPVQVPHYTKQQRTFARVDEARGGRVLFLLKVGEFEWFLFDGTHAAQVIGHLTREEMIRNCLCYCGRFFDERKLVKAIKEYVGWQDE